MIVHITSGEGVFGMRLAWSGVKATKLLEWSYWRRSSRWP